MMFKMHVPWGCKTLPTHIIAVLVVNKENKCLKKFWLFPLEEYLY